MIFITEKNLTYIQWNHAVLNTLYWNSQMFQILGFLILYCKTLQCIE